MTTSKIAVRIAAAALVSLLLAAFILTCGPSPKLYAQRAASQNANERKAVMKDLRGKKITSKHVPIILQGCRDEDFDVRVYAYYALSKADPREDGVAAAFINGMTDTSALVRRAVASSLADLDPFPTGIFTHMTKMLTDPDADVRNYTATAFRSLEGGGIGGLIRSIDTKDTDLRYAIVEVLGMIGPPAKLALPKLRTIAQSDTDPEIKAAALNSIERIDK